MHVKYNKKINNERRRAKLISIQNEGTVIIDGRHVTVCDKGTEGRRKEVKEEKKEEVCPDLQWVRKLNLLHSVYLN